MNAIIQDVKSPVRGYSFFPRYF